jgi:predicted enzyme related to lactoylglutathione lyase
MLGVVHFEIGAEEPERAAKFYTAVFGWKIASGSGRRKPRGRRITG